MTDNKILILVRSLVKHQSLDNFLSNIVIMQCFSLHLYLVVYVQISTYFTLYFQLVKYFTLEGYLGVLCRLLFFQNRNSARNSIDCVFLRFPEFVAFPLWVCDQTSFFSTFSLAAFCPLSFCFLVLSSSEADGNNFSLHYL